MESLDMRTQRGAMVRTVVHSRLPPTEFNNVEIVKGDLRKWSSCVRAVKGMDYIFHLAAFVGGVGRNASHPAGMFTLNILMNTQMLEAACLEGVERYLYTSRACIYSGKLSFFVEERGGDGPPEKTNASYGWVKRMGELQAQVYL